MEINEEKYYYIQDSRNYIGNAMLFWRKESSGYTTNIDEAEIYNKEQAERICRNRKTDIAWEVNYIETKISRCVDMQDVDQNQSGVK